jgi:undecaprenyl-diphosphatase
MTTGRLAMTGLAAVGAVALLAVAYRHDPVAAWDADIARWVGAHVPRPVEWLARPFSWLGGGVGTAAIALGVAAELARRARRWDAIAVVAAWACAEVVTQLVKASLDRPRPGFAPAVDVPTTAAFPSGHASVSLAVGLVVAAVAGGGLRRGGIALALGALVGLSRIALGVHWVSDVVAGWALGGGCACLVLLARGAHRRRR